MPFTEFSLDLETLNNKPNSPILSIGCVAFDSKTGIVDVDNGFHVYLKLDEQFRAGLLPSADTLFWWFEQSDVARHRQTQLGETLRMPVVSALLQFNSWLIERTGGFDWDEIKLYGNGSDFDVAILANLMDKFDVKPCWPFWGARCLRTFKQEVGEGLVLPEYGVAHDALDDAIKQAMVVTLNQRKGE